MFARRALVLTVTVMVLALGLTGVAWAQSFPDVPTSHSYYVAIEGMADKGIVRGYTSGDFGPDDPAMRQQFAKMIVKALGLTAPDVLVPFVDLDHSLMDESDPGYPITHVGLCWMYRITLGKDATHFAPYENITLQQLISMAVRGGVPELQTPPAGWTGGFDSGDPTHGENIRIAEYNGLLAGVQFTDTTLNATRGECAQVLSNLRSFVLKE